MQFSLSHSRLRSVLVQSAGEPVAAMAAYIDLNPIRAEMVEDPQEYRWSGYGAAMWGDPLAEEGLREIGSRSFVNEIFTTLKDRFGENRKTGARLIRGLEKEDKLYAMRDLKQGVVG